MQNYDKKYILEHITDDLAEGVMVISFTGKVLVANKAVCEILDLNRDEILEKSVANNFMGTNDDFLECILELVYYKETGRSKIVQYSVQDGLKKKIKHLKVTTSYLMKDGKGIAGIISVNDLTEIIDFRSTILNLKKTYAINEDKNNQLKKTFGRYLSDEIVNQLIEEPEGTKIGGDERRIVVLMSDVRGFTMMCRHNSSKDVLKVLNHYFEIMSEIIRKYNGTVIEFVGDGILAVFGAPIEDEHMEINAVCAALEMQKSMEDINKWNDDNSLPNLEIGIGINSGDAIVGNMGSEQTTKFNVIGDCVNMCGRIESYTVGGQVYVSDNIVSSIGSILTVDESKEITVKGINEPLLIHRISGIGGEYNITIKEVFDELTDIAPEHVLN